MNKRSNAFDSPGFQNQRQEMVRDQLERRDIRCPAVLDAMYRVPRHAFVLEEFQNEAYRDGPLPIGHRQTISQPYIVALMTQLANIQPDSCVLDVGTGSGYQAAILAQLAKQVFSIEIVKPLLDRAVQAYQRLGYENIHTQLGDGYLGYPGEAPFDVILVAAAPDHLPKPLIDQLAVEGRLIIPVGTERQELMLVTKKSDGTTNRQVVAPVAFVPMTGRAQG